MADRTPSELLLLRGKKVDGPRRVATTLRPLRIAYLVDSRDPRVALAAIEAACLEFGGFHQFLIPCTVDSQPTPTWERVIERYDPDWIADLVGVSTNYLRRHDEQFDRAAYVWKDPLETMNLTGALVYGLLRRWKRLRSPQGTDAAFYFTPLLGHRLALPLAVRFGHLELRPMPNGHILHDSYKSSRYVQFAELRTRDPRAFSEDLLARLIVDYTESVSQLFESSASMTNYHTLPDLTVVTLPSREPSYGLGAGLNPESEQCDEAYFRRVAVVGDPSSIDDLCLAWDLRAQRMGEWDSPIWIDPAWFSDPQLVPRIEFAMKWRSPGLSESQSGPPTVHLVSASMSRSELEEAAKGFPMVVVAHDSTLLDRFFTPDFKVGLTKESIVNFRDGHADIAMPDYTDLADFFPFERIGWTVQVEGYKVPRVSQRHCRRQGLASRLSSDGIAGFTTVYGEPGGLFPFGLNNGWQITAGVASQAGYKARLSDKGQLAVAVIGLLGDHMGLSLVSSSCVYELLKEMAEIVPRQATQRALGRLLGHDPKPEELNDIIAALQAGQIGGGQFERQHRSWAQLKSKLGVSPNTATAIVQYLVASRVLFRGYEVMCPNCGSRRWYPIDTLSEAHRCEGCQAVSSPTPVPVSQLEWRYRLNEAVARAIDQGALPHIVAAARLTELGVFGFLPGLLLEPKDAEGPLPIELDLFSVKNGRVLVGECKTSGSELTAEEVERLAALGKLLECSRIIYVTPASFANAAGVIQRAKAISEPIHVEVWEKSDLLDPLYHDGDKQCSPVQYLERLAEGLGHMYDVVP